MPLSSAAIPILFSDAALLVVDKPAGLLSVPGRLPENKDSLTSRLQAQDPAALNVHRLDQVTSGLMVFARSKAAQAHLSAQFAQRKVGKVYEAVVEGLLADDAGSVDLPLICDWPNRPRQMVDMAQGKAALTHWQVLARDVALGQTRLCLRPITGRSHQLRVHSMALGHPIVGDDFYGAQPAARVLLHATDLSLIHPETGQPMAWHSPAPF